MLCHATDDKPSAIKFYLNGRGAKEEGEAKEEEGEANLLQLSRARRSKTKSNQGEARVFYIFIEICVPKYGFIRPLGYVFLGKFVYLPAESPEKRCMMRRILSVGIGIV